MAHAGSETVTALLARAVVLKAQELGADAEEILRIAGAPPEVLHDASLRLTGTQTDRVWLAAIEATREPALGLLIGIEIEPTQLGPAATGVLAASHLAEAMEAAARFSRLIGRQAYGVQRRAGEVRFRMDGEGAPLMPNHEPGTELSMVVWQRVAQHFAGDQVRPTRVCFRHRRPAHGARLEAFFGCPVSFDAAQPEIRFALDDATRPSRFADPVLQATMDRYLDAQLARVDDTPPSTSEAVVRHVQLGADLRSVSAESTAEALGMSPRTLYRKLKAEGDSFQSVIDRVRHRLCLARLEAGQVAPRELSEMLGFSESSSFYRAFRRWTGRSFAEYRDGAPRRVAV